MRNLVSISLVFILGVVAPKAYCGDPHNMEKLNGGDAAVEAETAPPVIPSTSTDKDKSAKTASGEKSEFNYDAQPREKLDLGIKPEDKAKAEAPKEIVQDSAPAITDMTGNVDPKAAASSAAGGGRGPAAVASGNKKNNQDLLVGQTGTNGKLNGGGMPKVNVMSNGKKINLATAPDGTSVTMINKDGIAVTGKVQTITTAEERTFVSPIDGNIDLQQLRPGMVVKKVKLDQTAELGALSGKEKDYLWYTTTAGAETDKLRTKLASYEVDDVLYVVDSKTGEASLGGGAGGGGGGGKKGGDKKTDKNGKTVDKN